jgi:hypothetical protein
MRRQQKLKLTDSRTSLLRGRFGEIQRRTLPEIGIGMNEGKSPMVSTFGRATKKGIETGNFRERRRVSLIMTIGGSGGGGWKARKRVRTTGNQRVRT